jgi:hypothetical protein
VLFRSPWQQSVRLLDKYYDVEILIPYRSLGLSGPPKSGSRWALNIRRNDTLWAAPAEKKKGKKKKSNLLDGGGIQEEGPPPAIPEQVEAVEWAPTRGASGASGCYGILTFVAAPASATVPAAAGAPSGPAPAATPSPTPEPPEAP